jgi:hypothetical protein
VDARRHREVPMRKMSMFVPIAAMVLSFAEVAAGRQIAHEHRAQREGSVLCQLQLLHARSVRDHGLQPRGPTPIMEPVPLLDSALFQR